MSSQNVLLNVEHLKKYFRQGEGTVKAVDDVSFRIYEGETLGLVGETGCGKSTAGRTVVGLYDRTGGKVSYRGRDIRGLQKKDRGKFHREVQMVFQDPYSSLDPRMTVADIVGEGIEIHHLASSKEEETRKVYEILAEVGLTWEHANRFVHEFSGGQRQRIGIARALAVDPEFIVLDEPISALDVSIQAQIVNLLIDLQKRKGLTYLFIAHDLAMVKHISDRIIVMYLGHIVEEAPAEELYENPLHPYTRSLMMAIPIPDPLIEKQRKLLRHPLEGELPSPLNPPQGCPFCTRCPYAGAACHKKAPALKEVRPGHFTACLRNDEINCGPRSMKIIESAESEAMEYRARAEEAKRQAEDIGRRAREIQEEMTERNKGAGI